MFIAVDTVSAVGDAEGVGLTFAMGACEACVVDLVWRPRQRPNALSASTATIPRMMRSARRCLLGAVVGFWSVVATRLSVTDLI